MYYRSLAADRPIKCIDADQYNDVRRAVSIIADKEVAATMPQYRAVRRSSNRFRRDVIRRQQILCCSHPPERRT